MLKVDGRLKNKMRAERSLARFRQNWRDFHALVGDEESASEIITLATQNLSVNAKKRLLAQLARDLRGTTRADDSAAAVSTEAETDAASAGKAMSNDAVSADVLPTDGAGHAARKGVRVNSASGRKIPGVIRPLAPDYNLRGGRKFPPSAPAGPMAKADIPPYMPRDRG